MKIEVDPIGLLKQEILEELNFDVSKWTQDDLKDLKEIVKVLDKALNSRKYLHNYPSLEETYRLSKDFVIIDRAIYDSLQNNFKKFPHNHSSLEEIYGLPKDFVIIDRAIYDGLQNNSEDIPQFEFRIDIPSVKWV
jgi:hypothetical protein